MGKPSVGSWVGVWPGGPRTGTCRAFVVLPDPGGGLERGAASVGERFFLPADLSGDDDAPRKKIRFWIFGRSPRSARSQQKGPRLDLVRTFKTLGTSKSVTLTANWPPVLILTSSPFACRAAAPELVDLGGGRLAKTLELYGIGDKETDEFGTRCLLGAADDRARACGSSQLYRRRHKRPGTPPRRRAEKTTAALCRRTDKTRGRAAERPAPARVCSTTTLVVWGGRVSGGCP